MTEKKEQFNREILFRAWDKLEKAMTKPFTLSKLLDESYRHTVCLELEDGGFSSYMNSGTMKNFILMQYTGSKDKNGKNVFEGDILKDGWSEEGDLGVVKFEEGYISFGIGYIESETIQVGDSEVIGNVFENPKLYD